MGWESLHDQLYHWLRVSQNQVRNIMGTFLPAGPLGLESTLGLVAVDFATFCIAVLPMVDTQHPSPWNAQSEVKISDPLDLQAHHNFWLAPWDASRLCESFIYLRKVCTHLPRCGIFN